MQKFVSGLFFLMLAAGCADYGPAPYGPRPSVDGEYFVEIKCEDSRGPKYCGLDWPSQYLDVREHFADPSRIHLKPSYMGELAEWEELALDAGGNFALAEDHRNQGWARSIFGKVSGDEISFEYTFENFEVPYIQTHLVSGRRSGRMSPTELRGEYWFELGTFGTDPRSISCERNPEERRSDHRISLEAFTISGDYPLVLAFQDYRVILFLDELPSPQGDMDWRGTAFVRGQYGIYEEWYGWLRGTLLPNGQSDLLLKIFVPGLTRECRFQYHLTTGRKRLPVAGAIDGYYRIRTRHWNCGTINFDLDGMTAAEIVAEFARQGKAPDLDYEAVENFIDAKGLVEFRDHWGSTYRFPSKQTFEFVEESALSDGETITAHYRGAFTGRGLNYTITNRYSGGCVSVDVVEGRRRLNY